MASEKQWTDAVAKLLVGKKIVAVRYLSTEEAEDLDWHSRPIVIVLDDGVQIYPSRDDEGNDGGAMFTTDKKLETIPVL